MEHFSCDLSNMEFFLVCLFLCFNLSCFFLKKHLLIFWPCWVFITVQASLIPSSEDCSLVVVCGLLIAAASLVVEHGLQGSELQSLQHISSVVNSSWDPEHRLSNCGEWSQLPPGMWDLPRRGIEPMSLALAGRSFTTETPVKPRIF